MDIQSHDNASDPVTTSTPEGTPDLSQATPVAPDLELEDILKQFLKDFGEDGPINPLGVAINKIDHLIYQRLIAELTNLPSSMYGGHEYCVAQDTIDDRIAELDALNKLVGDQNG